MAKYRTNLPQMSGGVFMSDGGLETTLVFHKGIDLPYFAAFDLLKDQEGYQMLYDYYRRYCEIAQQHGLGFVLESATWRASNGWGEKMGYSPQQIAEFNRKAIQLLVELRNEYEQDGQPMVISGCIGPKGDGYSPEQLLNVEQAYGYHLPQIKALGETEADMVSAFTMTHAEEAIGIVRAAQSQDVPAVISFTVETDGRLPSGQALKDAITQVDIETDHGPAYYMINCAHPRHFENILADEPWLTRIQGIRANASKRSHAELDEAEELDDGNPEELGAEYRVLKGKLGKLNVIGGCCGTDHRHVEQMCRCCAA